MSRTRSTDQKQRNRRKKWGWKTVAKKLALLGATLILLAAFRLECMLMAFGSRETSLPMYHTGPGCQRLPAGALARPPRSRSSTVGVRSQPRWPPSRSSQAPQ